MVFVEMRYSFRTSGKTTASFKSNVLGFLVVLCCFCFYAVSCTSTSESSLNSSSSSTSGNVDNSTAVEELSLLATTNPTFTGQNVTSTESPVFSLITPSPSTPVIDQASLITTTAPSEAANSTSDSSSAVASTASSGPTVSSSSSVSEQSETNSTQTDTILAQTVTSSSSTAQSVTPTSTTAQSVTPTSTTAQSITPTSTTAQSVTPTSTTAQSVTPTSTTAQSVTPTSTTAQSVTPTSTTAQSITPTSTTVQSVTSTSTTAQSVTPTSSTTQSVTSSVSTVPSIIASSTKAPTTSTVSVSTITTSSTVSSVPSTQTVSSQSTLSESSSTSQSQTSSTESSSSASPVPSTAVPTENQGTPSVPSTQTVSTQSSPINTSTSTSQTQAIGSTSSSSPQIETSSSVPETTVSTVPSTTTVATPSTSSVSSTSASIESTESSNTTENITEIENITTTTTTKPILSLDGSASFDPSSILTFAQNFAQNTSKFVLKYVSKEQNGTNSTKQSGKYSFSDFGDGTNYTKFYAKYLTKNVETTKEDKFADFMPDDIRNKGGVVVHMILLVYVCFSLGIICDLYFLTSIEYIGNSLNLPSDIAGATFMALGTSAPELFIALIGVFIAEDDIGTSTIIGSAVFNLIFVPSVCGYAIYLSRMTYPKINKYSIMRDAIFYLVAIITLLLVLKDNEVDWIESLGMLSLYCIYVFILYLNAELGEIVDWEDEEEVDTSSRHSSTASTDSEITPLISQSRNLVDRQLSKSDKYNFTKSVDWMETGRSRANSIRTIPFMRRNSIRTSSIRNGSICNVSNNAMYLPIGKDSSVKLSTKPLPLLPKPSPDEEPSGMPENWAESNLWLKILMFPVVLAIKLTVPNPNRNNYYLTFLISIFWISGFTYMSVWLVTIIGKTFGLPSSVLGLTILAAGSSIPEVISSVIVVKRAGLANMALCNLFGSNIFDVLVCLGLPWLIKSIIQMVTIGSAELALSVVTVQSNGLLLSVFILLVCVVSFVLTLSYSKWKFGLAVGVMCSIIYFTAITAATISEITLN